jgi:hypothetical protein
LVNAGEFASGRLMLKALLNRDRRRADRYWFKRPLRVITDNAVIEGHAISISERGMFMFALATLPVGARIEIEIAVPRQGEVLRMAASVRHRAVYLYGVEFLEA